MDYLFLQSANNLEDAVEKCWGQFNKKNLASVRLKPVMWKKIQINGKKLVRGAKNANKTPSSKKPRASKSAYIQYMEYARDKFCRGKQEKDIFTRVIKRISRQKAR